MAGADVTRGFAHGVERWMLAGRGAGEVHNHPKERAL
jgi:hypothetical protein